MYVCVYICIYICIVYLCKSFLRDIHIYIYIYICIYTHTYVFFFSAYRRIKQSLRLAQLSLTATYVRVICVGCSSERSILAAAFIASM